MHRILQSWVATAAIAGIGCGSGKSDASWQPDPVLLAELQGYILVGDYEIRPPQGYRLEQLPSLKGMRAMAWRGPMRSDRTSPFLMVTIATPPPEAGQMTLGKFQADMLAGVRHQRQNWTESPVERGKVNGIEFHRVRWSGIEPNSKLSMHGFSYFAKVDDVYIQLTSQDPEPQQEAALKISETAALTFRKK